MQMVELTEYLSVVRHVQVVRYTTIYVYVAGLPVVLIFLPQLRRIHPNDPESPHLVPGLFIMLSFVRCYPS